MFLLGRRIYDLKLKWSDHNEIWLKLLKKICILWEWLKIFHSVDLWYMYHNYVINITLFCVFQQNYQISANLLQKYFYYKNSLYNCTFSWNILWYKEAWFTSHLFLYTFLPNNSFSCIFTHWQKNKTFYLQIDIITS